MTIRPVATADLHRLGDIEVAAGRQFAAIGMPEVADDPPLPVEELARHRAWVAVDGDDRPVGYVLVDEVDGCAHVGQISVHPDFAGHGIGRRLLDTVAAWAAVENLVALTLVTFRDVPWNRPYYERLGFRVVGDDAELHRAPRVCMRRDL